MSCLKYIGIFLLLFFFNRQQAYAQDGADYGELKAYYQTYINYLYTEGDTSLKYTFKLFTMLYDGDDQLIDTIQNNKCFYFTCANKCGQSMFISPGNEDAAVVHCTEEYCGIHAIYPLFDSIGYCFLKNFKFRIVLYMIADTAYNCSFDIEEEEPVIDHVFEHTYINDGRNSNSIWRTYTDTLTVDSEYGRLRLSMLNSQGYVAYLGSFIPSAISGHNTSLTNAFCMEDTVVTMGMFDLPADLEIYRSPNDDNSWVQVPDSLIQDVEFLNHNIGYLSGTYGGYSWFFRKQLREKLDTLNDATVDYNKNFTVYEYRYCYESECGDPDSAFCLNRSVIIIKPLAHIPYTITNVCAKSREEASGVLSLNMNQRHGGYSYVYKPLGGYRVFGNIDSFTYELYKDERLDHDFDSCYTLYTTGRISASGTVNLQGLLPGDYSLRILPYTRSMTGLEYYQACETDFRQIFSVDYFYEVLSLGPDRIICEDSTVRLEVPEAYNEGGNTTVWAYCYCPLDTSAIANHGHYIDISAGAGGYHYVQVQTTTGCVLRDTVLVADLNPPAIPLYTLPNVINTSAVKYNSNWTLQPNTISWKDAQAQELFNSRNPYANGTAGMFRPEKDYDYLDVRSQTETTDTTGVNIREDGSIPDYIFFNYSDPNFFRTAPQWTLNNTIMGYNPSGYDIEGKDILNNFSAALYAYRDKLPVAKAVNAKYDEVGFESFEEYDNDPGSVMNFDSVDQLTNSTGNIDLVSHLTELTSIKNKDYEIVAAFNKYAMIDGNVCTACDEPFKAKIYSSSVPKTISEKIKILTSTSYNTTISASPCGLKQYHILQLDDNIPGDVFNCNYWTGKAVVGKERYQPAAGPYDMELATSVSHTGKNSLKINADARIAIPQIDIELQPGKQYMLGAWVRSAAMDEKAPEVLRFDHARDSIGIIVRLPNNEKILMKPSGEVIEGWQRVEGSFTMPKGERTTIQFLFTPKTDMYLDDIRIYPFNGSMQTYVYDKRNYKLRATLDHNNYATLYQYDEEGNLFLLKKETVDGIKTIQLSGSYIKPNK